VPQQMVSAFAGGGFDLNQTTEVGKPLGQLILDSLPAAARPIVEPQIPKIVTSIYEAISLAIGQIFWFGLGTAAIALVAILVIRELPLRSSLGPGRAPASAGAGGPASAGGPAVPGGTARRAPAPAGPEA
jgi:hypothetical protein